MTETEATSVSREARRGIRYGILAVLVVGFRRRNPGAVANAVVALGSTYLPGIAEGRFDIEIRPWQRVYVDAALLTHAIGMLGPYDDVWWWDHLTHTYSATVLGGFVHKIARRNGRDPRPRVLAIVVGGGVVWEIAEYAIHTVADRFDRTPLLVTYSRRDTLLDLVFDLFGAVLVLAFGDRILEDGRSD